MKKPKTLSVLPLLLRLLSSEQALATTRVVLTGGPGVGKTSIVKRLIELNYDVRAEVFTEIFEKAVAEERFDALLADGPKLLHDLVTRQGELETCAPDAPLVLFDRSVVDIIGFASNLKLEFTPEDQAKVDQADYDLVFVVEPLPEEFYDQNAVRRQTFKESLEEHAKIVEHYRHFLIKKGKDPEKLLIPVPVASIEERTQFIVDRLAQFIRQ